MANKVTIDIEARFVDSATTGAKATSKAFKDVEKSAEGAQKEMDNLGKKRPKLDVDDGNLKRKLDATDKKLSRLGRLKTNLKILATDKASKIIDKAVSKAKAFGGKTYSALLKVRDSNALSTLNKISNTARNIAGKTWHAAVKVKDYATAPLRGIKNMLFSIKSLVLAITAGLAAQQFVMKPIGLADAYTSAKIGFSTLLGESRGQQMMDELDAFAKATPFKSSQVIQQTQRMLAMGWDAESIIDDMRTIGDAAASTGKGEQGLQQIVTALAQIKTKGKLSTEELNQLAEAGISAKRYIAEGLGYGSGDKGIAKMTKALEGGKIASDKALGALLAGMKEYQGMMDATANETVEGLWSQIEDTFEINIFRRWGQGLQDGAKVAFGSLVSLIDDADAALDEFGDTIYEVGQNISSWAAEKLEKSVKRITDITGSYEFQNANLGKKISMLWKGVIVDPLREWWEGGGREKTTETAGKIGKWLGETLTKGLLAIFGMTDILKDGGLDASGGASVAQSFAQGFVDGFDVSAITDKLVDAIRNVWNALPWWAKILVGGYGVGKAAGGIANFAGGVASFLGGVKNTVGGFKASIVPVGPNYVAGSGLLGTIGKAGVGLGATTTGGALLMGSAGIAGGLAGGASIIKGGIDLYDSYRAYKAGDETEGKAKTVSGTSAMTGALGGAAVGAIFGPLGALIGAGIGGIGGWLLGERQADKIRETKYEIEGTADAIKAAKTEEEKLAALNEAAWESMKSHMGDVKLSASEIVRLADQIVWGDDLAKYEQFSTATKQAESSLQSLKTAAEATNRWMWKAGLGVKFNEDEIESIVASFDEYIGSAQSYMENKHYEFTTAVSLLVDVESEGGKSILGSGNAFYGKLQEQLNGLGGKLSEKVHIALEDGVITLDEQAEITNLQQQIAEITEKISNAETKAEIELVRLKFGKGNLDLESFNNFMAQMETTLNERIAANDEAFKASVATLNLELEEGAISQEEYDQQLQTLVGGYTGKVDSIKAEIMSVELDIIGDAYKDVLGEDAAAKLQSALEKSLSEGIHPKEWTVEDAQRFLGIEDLKDDTAIAIATMLGGMADQIELVEVDGKLLLDVGIETKGNTAEKVNAVMQGQIPESMDADVTVNLTAFKNIRNNIDILAEEFGIPESKAETILWELSGTKTIAAKVAYLAKEFGINDSEAHTVLWKLTGQKSIMNTFSLYASDFGIKSSYSFSPTISISPSVSKPKSSGKGSGYRGGIFGGDSAMDSFYRGGLTDNSGIVGGSTRFIRVNEESPEMIIPLSSQRRGRALKLWAQAGNIMRVPGFARGGLTNGGADEGIRFQRYGSDDSTGGKTGQVEIHGVTVELHIDARGSENITEAIEAQKEEIAEIMAGILADAFAGQFENTPVRGGAA